MWAVGDNRENGARCREIVTKASRFGTCAWSNHGQKQKRHSMALLDDVSVNLARQALELIVFTGDETIERRIADEIGASSPTLQENYLTAMRILKAERRGLLLLEKYRAGDDIPVAQISSQPQDDGGH